MDWHTIVENAYSPEGAGGQLTRRDTEILVQRLASLAVNATLAGRFGVIPHALAARWLFYVHSSDTRGSRDLSPRRQALAENWVARAAEAGTLRVTERGVAFADDSLREFFCVVYARTRPLDERVLRLAARPAFPSVWRLWSQQDPALVERLNTLLVSGREPPLRARAATILGYLSDARARGPLLAAYQSAQDVVRVAAAGALAAYSDPDLTYRLAQDIVQSPSQLRPPLFAALGSAGEPSVDALLDLLHHSDSLVVRAAIIGLGHTGSVRAATPLLLHADTSDEGHVVTALARLGETSVPLLISAYHDERRPVRERARRAIGQLGFANAAVPLLALLREERRRDPHDRCQEIVRALINQCTPDNADVFAWALTDADDEVLRCAALALAHAGDRRALEPLLTWLRLRDTRSHVDIVKALGELGDVRATEPLIAALGTGLPPRDAPGQAESALADLRLPADLKTQLIYTQSRLADSYERAEIAKALGRLGDTRAVEPLLTLLPAAGWIEGPAAAQALIRLRAVAAVEPLLEMLQRRRWETPASAIRVLGRLGDRRAADALLALLQDPMLMQRLLTPPPSSGDTFAAVVAALAALRERRALAPILRTLQEMRAGAPGSSGRGAEIVTQRPVAIYAVLDALGTFGDPRAIEPLLSFVSPRTTLGQRAIVALTQIVDQRSLDGLLRIQQECPPPTILAGQLPKAIRTLSARLEQRARKHARSRSDTPPLG